MALTRWISLGLACLATVGCASTDWEARYRDKERQASELTTDLDAAREDLARLQEGNRMLTDQLARERAERDQLGAELVTERTRP